MELLSLGTSCGRRYVFLRDFDGRWWDNKMQAGDLLGKAHPDGFGFSGVGGAGIEPWLRDNI